MILKRILTGSFIIMICVMMFLTGYTRVTSSYCYADSTTDEWTQVTTNKQLVEAFRYYCKSRDLTIDGSVADGVTTFTTKTFNGLCNTLGIDMTALQAEIKYRTDSNLGLQYLFTTTGVTAYNRIFSQFLQDNNLSVGDQVNNQTLYSGKTFLDYNNNTVLCTIADTNSTPTSDKYNASNVYAGTAVYSNSNQYYDANYFRPFINNTGGNINYTVYTTENNSSTELVNSSFSKRATYVVMQSCFLVGENNGVNYDGYIGIVYVNSLNGYYICAISKNLSTNKYAISYLLSRKIYPKNNNARNCNVYITTNNNTINNNTYEGDTIINNNGDTVVDEPIPDDPVTPPYDPYPGGGGTTTPDDNVGGGDQSDDTNITFPNFEFNFPEIDWSIGDLSKKFPFSIPFDLIAFFTVLNAEPEAPKIDTNIPLGNWYTWHFAADFSQFDRYASIVRHVEFISFVVALIYLTIRLVKG